MASIEPLKSVTISVAQETIQIRTDLPDAELNDIVENINQRFERSAKFQMDNRKRMALLAVELMSEIMELRKQLGRAKNYYDQMEKEVQKKEGIKDFTVGEPTIEENKAVVPYTLTYGNGDTKEDKMKLVKTEDGKWMIDSGK